MQLTRLLDLALLTLKLAASKLIWMVGKKMFLILVAVTALILQFADCMAAFSQDQQAMQCCGASTCTPSNQSHGCCKTMNSTETPRMLVKARVSLDVPTAAVVEHAPALETGTSTLLIPFAFEPRGYSPPDLYTLHSSLLI